MGGSFCADNTAFTSKLHIAAKQQPDIQAQQPESETRQSDVEACQSQSDESDTKEAIRQSSCR